MFGAFQLTSALACLAGSCLDYPPLQCGKREADPPPLRLEPTAKIPILYPAQFCIPQFDEGVRLAKALFTSQLGTLPLQRWNPSPPAARWDHLRTHLCPHPPGTLHLVVFSPLQLPPLGPAWPSQEC